MKRFLATALAVMSMATTAIAGDVNVIVNEVPIQLQGTIVEGRTLVPVRGVFEELGYTVSYLADSKTAIITGGGSVVKMTQGDTFFTVNDEVITPDVPQQIIEDRFMLPLRAVSEAVGAEVDWEAETRTVKVTAEKVKAGLKVQGTFVLE